MSRTPKILFSPASEIANPKKRTWLKEFANNPRCVGAIFRTSARTKISTSTFYKWMEEDPAFAAEFKCAREFAIECLENRLDRAAMDEEDMNVTAAIFRLKGLRPEMYRERHEISMTRQEREARIAELLAKRGSSLPVPTSEETNGHTAE